MSTSPTPDIPQGFAFTETPPNPTQEEEEESSKQVDVEGLATLLEAQWNGKETKARLLHLALEIPQPFDSDTLNTCHPFWTEGEYKQLKTHYHTFLLSL